MTWTALSGARAVRRAACLSVLLLAACGQSPGPAPKAATTPVRVVRPTLGPSRAPIVTSGVITARDEQTLSFRLGGVLRQVRVVEGQTVRAGQLLAELLPTDIDAALAQVEQLQLKARRDLERGERLYAEQVISLEQLQNLQTQAQVAAAQWQAARFNQRSTKLLAPADGVVQRKFAEANETVAPGQPIVTVGSRASGYIVRAGVADRERVQLQLGDPASVHLDALPGVTLTGRVTVLGGAAARENGLFPIEVQVQDLAQPLVPGMVARLHVSSQSATASLLYIPTGAIVSGLQSQAAVFVADHGRARKRQVQVAFFTRDQVAIQSGLNPDDQVITDGALYLSEGEAIDVSGI